MIHRYESGEFNSADSVHFSESEKFSTRRTGRTVYGGGGIMPDVFVPVDTTGYSDYYRDLTAKGVILRYASNYVDENRKQLKKSYPTEESFLKNFKITPAMISDIVAMGVTDSVAPNPEQLDVSRSTIEAIVKGIIGRDIFDQATYFKVVNPVLNPIYTRALGIINDPEEYDRLLHP